MSGSRRRCAGFGGTRGDDVRDTTAPGTDRIAEVARELDCDIVVNVQGDEPLIPPAMIEQVIAPLRDRRRGDVDAAAAPSTDPEDVASIPHVVKVVVDRDDDALYFSRAADSVRPRRRRVGPFKHVGLYGYRRRFLLELAALPQTPLEAGRIARAAARARARIPHPHP